MKKKQSLLLLLPITLCTMTLTSIFVFSPDIARLYVDLPIVYKEKDASFTVDIKVADVANLYSWQVNMSFNPSVLTYVNVTEGPFLKGQPEGTSFGGRIEQTKGWMLFGWSTVGKYAGISGTGTLATVKFQVSAIGESILNINQTKTTLYEVLPPPVPPGGEPVRKIPYTPENGFFTNLVKPPQAKFTYSPSAPGINELIDFDATESAAIAPNAIIKYIWDFGDDTTEVYVKDVNLTATTTHAYTGAGAYTVTLTVVDNASATDLIEAVYGMTSMPEMWYEFYSTQTAAINILFGHDVAVTAVAVSKNRVTAGETVSINVTVVNKGSVSESFDVTAYFGNSEIGTKSVTDLVPTEGESLLFNWDTTNVTPGDHQIRATADLEGDGFPQDNAFTDGTVKVDPVSGGPPILLIVGAVVGVGVLAGGVFLFMRRRGSSQVSS